MDHLHTLLQDAALLAMLAAMIRGYLWLKDLWRWHAKEDEEGVKVWYIRKSLGDAIDKIAAVMEKIDRREEQREKREEQREIIMIDLVRAVERLAGRIEATKE